MPSLGPREDEEVASLSDGELVPLVGNGRRVDGTHTCSERVDRLVWTIIGPFYCNHIATIWE